MRKKLYNLPLRVLVVTHSLARRLCVFLSRVLATELAGEIASLETSYETKQRHNTVGDSESP